VLYEDNGVLGSYMTTRWEGVISTLTTLATSPLLQTCEAGDLLWVPANTPHWFDCGEHPDFTAIRIFTNPA